MKTHFSRLTRRIFVGLLPSVLAEVTYGKSYKSSLFSPDGGNLEEQISDFGIQTSVPSQR